MKKQFTGYIDAVCPTCNSIVRRDEVKESNLERARDFILQKAFAFWRWYPYARINTTDPLAKR